MAPDSAQKIANAASAVHVAPVNSRCAKTSPARTNRFLTHCRGRIETTIALSIAIAAKRAPVESCPRSRGGGGGGRMPEGSTGPRGTRALLLGGWAPSGRSATRRHLAGTGPVDPSGTRPPPPGSVASRKSRARRRVAGGGSSVRELNPRGLACLEADDVGGGRQAAGGVARVDHEGCLADDRRPVVVGVRREDQHDVPRRQVGGAPRERLVRDGADRHRR